VSHSVARPSSVALPVLGGFAAPTGPPSCADLRNQPCRANTVPVPTQ
jgi:hypothetical protein